MVNPFVVVKVVKIVRAANVAGTTGARPVAAFLIRRKLIRTATGPLKEGLAVWIFDRQLGNVSRQRTGGVGTLFPTSDVAADAFLKGIKAQRSQKGIAVIKRSQIAFATTKAVGLTPFVPFVNNAIRDSVIEGLGVPKWVIVASRILF